MDLIGVDVDAIQRRDEPVRVVKACIGPLFHVLISTKCPSTAAATAMAVTRDGCARLCPGVFKVAIARGSTAFARLKHIRIHRQTHATARFTPFEAGFREDPVESFLFCLLLHQSGPGTTIA